MRVCLILCAVGMLILAEGPWFCVDAAPDEGTILRLDFDSLSSGESPAQGFAAKALVSGAQTGKGIRGTGISFDGEDDAALVLDPGRDRPLAAFAAETWVLQRESVKGRAVIVGKRARGQAKWAFLLGVEDGRPFATLNLEGGEKDLEVQLHSGEKLELDWFHHVAVSFNSGRGRALLCVDGKAVDTVWVEPERCLTGSPGRI